MLTTTSPKHGLNGIHIFFSFPKQNDVITEFRNLHYKDLKNEVQIWEIYMYE
jgi:hypothetical protein